MSSGADVFSKIPQMDYRETAPVTDPEAFRRILEARRSVRVYDGSPVPEAVMREVLEWGLLAPNSSNLQCWEFFWVRDQPKKKALAKACFNQPAARTAAELIVVVGRPSHWRKHAKQMLEVFSSSDVKVPSSATAYYAKLAPFVYTQGPLGVLGLVKRVLYTVRGLFAVTPREPVSHAGMRLWAAKSAALACENIMLGFSAHGFDSCPMEGYDSCRVKKLLGLKRSDEIVMVISAGKRADNGVYGPRVRFPSSQFIKEV